MPLFTATPSVPNTPAPVSIPDFPVRDFFSVGQETSPSKISSARKAIRKLLVDNRPLKVAWSAGKDSWAMLTLTLTTAREVQQELGYCPPIVVTHADVGIENPEVWSHAKAGIQEIEDYGAKHGLPVSVLVSLPYLNDEFAVKVIGGRALPAFPGQTHDCTIDWKTSPQNRLSKQVQKDLKKEGFEPFVTLIGTRFDESAARSKSMEERQETADEVWSNPKGEDFLSPIAQWDDADVWRYLGAIKNGEEEGVSRLESLFRLYRDGSSKISQADGCEVYHCRFGCSICTVGKDKSMESMLEKDPDRYGYMEGLNRLQRFLMDTQYDFGRRQWIGRTLDEHGYIAIQPDVYAPNMLEELLRYTLTLDVREAEAAARLGIAPRFQLVSEPALIAIDAMWSMQGTHPAHHALKIYKQIYHEGQRFDVPEEEKFKRVPMPKARYLYVGEGWRSGFQYSGLRNASLEGATFDVDESTCGGLRDLPDGRRVMDVNRGKSLDVDPEGAGFILGFELDYLLKNYGDNNRPRGAAYSYYLSLGVLQLEAKQPGIADAILRRSAYKEAMGLTDDGTDLDAILRQTISAKERQAIIVAKATAVEEEPEETLGPR